MIDADKLLLKLKEEIMGNEPACDFETDGSDATYDTVVDIINNTPTAYDVDKVVEQIEALLADSEFLRHVKIGANRMLNNVIKDVKRG